MVKTELTKQNLISSRVQKDSEVDTEFLVTDNLQRFRKVGYYFVGSSPSPLHMVDLTDSDEQIVASLL